MAVNDKPLGASGTTLNDMGNMGALTPILGRLAGGSKGGQMAIDFAQQMYPDPPKADPYEAALQFFLAMGQGASQPGATVLGSAVGAMQAPADYLAAKKKEKRETDRARMQTALQLAPSLKPKPTGAGSLSTIAKLNADLKAGRITKEQHALAVAKATNIPDGSSGAQSPLGKLTSDLRDGLITQEQFNAQFKKLTDLGGSGGSGAESPLGKLAADLRDGLITQEQFNAQFKKLTDLGRGETVREPKFSDDGTGTLRYTANPPEGKNIGDIVFEGVDITGFTQNEYQLANALRDDLTKQIEPFRDIKSAFSQIDGFYEEAQSENSPVSDYSLAVQYAKVIDPGTAAREGEVAAIATAGAMSSAFKAALTNALMGTGKLSPRMRASIYNNALRIYGTKLPGALATIERYKTQSNAQKDGLFDLVGLNVDAESYKPVGEGGYQPKDIDSLEETPEDNSTYNFPPDFNFNSLDRNALLGLLRLPAGSLDERTLEKIDEALSD